jgi:hypothetical protein
MTQTAELLVVETTRSAPYPKQLSTNLEKPQEENDSFVYRSMHSVPRCSMGLKLTTRDPENFALLILEVADGAACSLLAFFEDWLMSFHASCDARY